MKIINAHSELIDRPNNQLKLVERIGRTCYKSEDLITDDSYIKFCNGLAKRKHYAMLEHAVFTFEVRNSLNNWLLLYLNNCQEQGYKYFVVDTITTTSTLVSANLRAIIETNNTALMNLFAEHYEYLQELLCNCSQYDVKLPKLPDCVKKDITFFDTNAELVDRYERQMNDPKLFKEYMKKIFPRHMFCTAYFQCDRGVTHEFVRHRPCSFAQSSTRYCNYSKGKFGNEITVIKPCFFSEENNDTNYWYWLDACKHAEQTYMWLINNGAKPEEARSVLPTSVAAELWITATLEEWQHIVNLRYLGTTGKPHPQMIEVMKPIAEQLQTKYPETFSFTSVR